MSVLRASLIALAFLAVTLPLMPLQWLLAKVRSPLARKLPHFYHRLVCRLLGVSLHVEGKVPASGLLAANHVSWLDIPVLSAVLPVTFVAKKEVGRWPFFGSLARLQGSVFVDRESRQSTGPSRSEMASRLKAGEAVVLFPEGTSHTGRGVKPFKSTFFGAVEHHAVAVIPVTLIYQQHHGLPLTLRQRPRLAWYGDMELLPHLWQLLKGGPVAVTILFHDELRAEAFGNRKALAREAERHVKAGLSQRLHARPKIG